MKSLGILFSLILSSSAFAQSVDCAVLEGSIYGIERVAVVEHAMPHHPEVRGADVYINGEKLKGVELGQSEWTSIELLRTPAKDSPEVFKEEMIVKLEKNRDRQPVLNIYHTCNVYMNEERCGADYLYRTAELNCQL